MESDDPVVAEVLNRLQKGEFDGRLNFELGKLSYAQLLTISKILAERSAPKE